MLSRKVVGVFALAALVAIGATALLPAAPAQGHTSRPPFEFKFPTEPDKATHFNDWRAERSGGRRHRGNDLMAPKMTEVYAFADGVVGQLGDSWRSGRYVRIDHAEHWRSYYIHLNNDNIGTDDGEADWSLTVAPGIQVGTEVKAGQVIGWVGDSGNAEWSQPHVHFELHRNGYPLNPYYTLREARDRDLAELEWRAALLEAALEAYRIR